MDGTNSRARVQRDAGMSLLEVIIALGLFAVLATSVLSVLNAATVQSRDDKFRLQAVNLATRELEISRDTFTSLTRGPDRVEINRVYNPNPLPGGVVGKALVVDNVPYTVVRTATWSAVGEAASTCDEGTSSELAYLRVQVEVSWPGLEGRPPVAMHTVLTPPKGTYSSLSGHIGIKIIDSLGAPDVGRSVTVKNASRTVTSTTAADGCALFPFLDAGTYNVTVNAAGFVNRKGDPTGSLTAQVQPGQLWRGSIEYDNSAAIAVTFTTLAGYALPSNNTLPVALGNSGIVPSGSRVVTGTGQTRTVSNLWPYPAGYQLWAGPCLDNDPQFSGDQRDLPVPSSPGGSTPATVTLAAIEVVGPANRTVTATHAKDNACTAPVTVTLGVTNSAGRLKTSLPYGKWTVASSTVDDTVTLYKDDPAQMVTLS